MYPSELSEALKRDWTDGFTEVSAAQVYGEHVLGASEDHVLVCTDIDRNRIFNLGYYTWVEQQGVSIEEFPSPPRAELLALAARYGPGLGRSHHRAERPVGRAAGRLKLPGSRGSTGPEASRRAGLSDGHPPSRARSPVRSHE